MRYGCCSNMLARGEALVQSNLIGMLAACGYDYIELSVVDCIRLTRANRLELKKRLDGAGLRAEVFNSLFPRELKTTGPDVNPKKVQDWYKQALELARSFGAKYVIYGSPYSKSYPLGYDRARAYEQLLLLHRAMDEYAGQLEMSLLIEPCHRFECNLINTFAEGVELAKCVAGKNTAVIFDYYHFLRNAERLDALIQYGRQYLRHIHFACPFHPGEPERTFPLDVREWDYEPLCSAVKDIGYDDRISIEAVCMDLGAQAARALRVTKELFGR